jgi:hypothetical protein
LVPGLTNVSKTGPYLSGAFFRCSPLGWTPRFAYFVGDKKKSFITFCFKTEALKISPQNREVHKNMIKVKEEMKRKKDEEENNNNNADGGDAGSSKPVTSKLVYPVGASHCDAMKFVDDSASEISHRSNQ